MAHFLQVGLADYQHAEEAESCLLAARTLGGAAADARGMRGRYVPADVMNIEGALYFCTFFMARPGTAATQPALLHSTDGAVCSC